MDKVFSISVSEMKLIALFLLLLGAVSAYKYAVFVPYMANSQVSWETLIEKYFILCGAFVKSRSNL